VPGGGDRLRPLGLCRPLHEQVRTIGGVLSVPASCLLARLAKVVIGSPLGLWLPVRLMNRQR
jgi:hypothetical protein